MTNVSEMGVQCIEGLSEYTYSGPWIESEIGRRGKKKKKETTKKVWSSLNRCRRRRRRRRRRRFDQNGFDLKIVVFVVFLFQPNPKLIDGDFCRISRGPIL